MYIPDCEQYQKIRENQYFWVTVNGACLDGYFSQEDLFHIADHMTPVTVQVDLAGPHSCDQACCAKIPGKYCADDHCNCGLPGNHATLPPV